ncbi:MAG: glycosyl hydrolase [Gammaproteobacteria bacterium]
MPIIYAQQRRIALRDPDENDRMIACLSCNGGTATQGAQAATTLFVATLQGVHRFERETPEESWAHETTTLPERHISALLWEPRNELLFAGAHRGGLWISEDRGRSWASCINGIASEHIYTLALQYRDDKVVLFAGTEPVALYRSDDLGGSWRQLGPLADLPGNDKWTFPPPPHIAHVKNIAFHDSEPETLYVCIEQGALLKSTDDGESWSEKAGYAAETDFFYRDNHRLLIRPSNPQELFMCGGEGLYFSPDAGESWQHLTTRDDRIGYPDGMFIDPRDQRTLYMAGPSEPPRRWGETGVANATVMRSTDGGHDWEEINTGLPDPVVGNIEALGLYHCGAQVMLLAGTATGQVFACENAGDPWYLVAEGLPPISKGGHYRWFLNEAERARVEEGLAR